MIPYSNINAIGITIKFNSETEKKKTEDMLSSRLSSDAAGRRWGGVGGPQTSKRIRVTGGRGGARLVCKLYDPIMHSIHTLIIIIIHGLIFTASTLINIDR